MRPIKDASGRVTDASRFARDFTEKRKGAEGKLCEARRQLHAANLESTVAKRTARPRDMVNEFQ
jgi:hypothetical protein